MSTTFKTCVFGGFDREDVISYIEKTAKENKERLQELTDANEKLRRENESMSGELAALRESAGKYEAIVQEYESLRAQVAELQEQSRALEDQSREMQKKNEQLRVQADEYQALRDHIAEIEISAHRRTQEFRAAAVEQLHGMVERQRENYAQQRQAFSGLYDGLRSQIQAAQDALGALDLSGFDSIDGQLQELDAGLDE